MYQLEFREYFIKKYLKLINKNPILDLKIEKKLIALGKDPFEKSFRTHKVNAKNFGSSYSSRVTGDIRIIWQYNPDNNNEIQILELLDIGGHSGGNRVY